MIERLAKLLFELARLILAVIWEVFRALLPFGLGRLLPRSHLSKDDDDGQDADASEGARRGDPAGHPKEPAASGASRGREAVSAEQMQALQRRLDLLSRQAEADPRLTRMGPVVVQLQVELLPALQEQLVSEQEGPHTHQAQYARLSVLVRYLEHMQRQRMGEDIHYLGDADAAADACFAPLIEFARAEGIPLSTQTPVVVHGDWDLSVDLSFRDAAIAPVRLPPDFRTSVYLWPALAHEVAHDFYFSVDGLEDALYERLQLPFGLMVPDEPSGYSGFDPRLLLGPWLPEIFADLVGLLQMGPAYAIAMERLFSEPAQPEHARAASEEDGRIETHPPAELRIQIAAMVLEHLGRTAEAGELLGRWNRVHDLASGYYLPSLSGRWARVPTELLLGPTRALVQALLSERWPTLSGYPLMGIPGFAYLHADHARVQALTPALAAGRQVRGDARLIIAAGVLAVDGGADEGVVMTAMRRSIVGVGTGETRATNTATPRAAGKRLPIAQEVVATLRSRSALVDAVVLGATLRRRQ